MKKKTPRDYSGIIICDSITMSVKKKNHNLRKIESLIIAVLGFVSVIMSFLTMYDFNYSVSAVIQTAVISSAFYIFFTLAGKRVFWYVGGSMTVFALFAWKFCRQIINGYKYVYNVIYCDSTHTSIKYYKLLPDDSERYAVTVFFVFCIWLLAMVIYTFTIYRPNIFIVVLFTFPVIEVGLYNGIDISVFWGILIIAYWMSLISICCTDIGEYYGGNSGFVRKGNVFSPKRGMRFKVTEKCAVITAAAVLVTMILTMGVMKLTGYKRSEDLNIKRANIKDAINSFTFDDLASSISNLTESFGFTFTYEDHRLGNVDQIKYKNTIDLKATFDKKYEGAVYLKGYAGAVYGENEWKDLSTAVYSENKKLFDDFEQYDIYPQDLPQIFTDCAMPENSMITLWLEAERKRNKSYAPYGTKNYNDMEYNHDTTVSSKQNGNKNYSYKFSGIDAFNSAAILGGKTRDVHSLSEVTDKDWLEKIDNYCTENELYVYNDYFSIDTELNYGDKSEELFSDGQFVMAQLIENEYRNFVYENYLQVPDNENMSQVYEVFGDLIESAASASTATEKLALLESIRERINSMTEYSTSPGKTPSNRDFVNYFLLENHKGYCTHYASSGVLLARMAGIPARYATGYIVVGDDFSDDAKNNDGTYTIALPDSRSHAWAEIYLDGFGWVPFEFTVGYSNMTIDTNTSTEAAETTDDSTGTTEEHTRNSSERRTNTGTRITSGRTSTSAVVYTTAVQSTEKNYNGIFPGLNDGPGGRRPLTEMQKNIIFAVSTIIFVFLLIYCRRCIIISMRKKSFSRGRVSERMAEIYGYADKLLSFMKIKRENQTYADFADYVEEVLTPRYFNSGEYRHFVETALESSFAPDECSVKTAEEAAKFARHFAHEIYKRSKLPVKIYMKIILVLI